MIAHPRPLIEVFKVRSDFPLHCRARPGTILSPQTRRILLRKIQRVFRIAERAGWTLASE